MMIIQETADELMTVLRREVALLERLAAAQQIVREAVFAREWANLEAVLKRLSAYGEEFEDLDRERVRLFKVFRDGQPEAIGFYAMASQLDSVRKRELTDLYRRLKLDVLKVRLANGSLAAYLDEAKSLVGDFLAAAFPDRKGRLYSRRGAAVASDMSSLVLNQTL